MIKGKEIHSRDQHTAPSPHALLQVAQDSHGIILRPVEKDISQIVNIRMAYWIRREEIVRHELDPLILNRARMLLRPNNRLGLLYDRPAILEHGFHLGEQL